MNQIDSDDEFAMAIAAAAFATTLLQEEEEERGGYGSTNREESVEFRSQIATKSRRDDTMNIEPTNFANTSADQHKRTTRETPIDRKNTQDEIAPSVGNPASLYSTKKNRDWEKEEMAKIKNRYEKSNATILKWEDENKTKAKCRMEQQEKGLERRRAAALNEYHIEMSWIDKMTGEARAITEEKKRNGESKTRKKTQQKVRSKEKNARSCFCF